MGTLYERIISLCQEQGITGGKMCTDLRMSKGTLTDLKMGRQKIFIGRKSSEDRILPWSFRCLSAWRGGKRHKKRTAHRIR